MKVVVLYRPNSEHGRSVEVFIHDFKHRHEAGRLEVIDIDSREGSSMASLYDVMQYPAVLAMADDGSLLRMWSGDMPLMNEIAYYTFASA